MHKEVKRYDNTLWILLLVILALGAGLCVEDHHDLLLAVVFGTLDLFQTLAVFAPNSRLRT